VKLSDESYQLIAAHLIHGATTVALPGVREKNRTALAELRALVVGEQGRTSEQGAAAADQALIDQTVRWHSEELLKLSVHRPEPGEIFPALPFAQAQWHQLRILALRTAPPDLAAAQLREEAWAALTPKEQP